MTPFCFCGQRLARQRRLVQAGQSLPEHRKQRATACKEAEREIKNGLPLLQSYISCWMANLVERMWLVIRIIIAVMLPLSRILPPLYTFRVRSRIFRR